MGFKKKTGQARATAKPKALERRVGVKDGHGFDVAPCQNV